MPRKAAVSRELAIQTMKNFMQYFKIDPLPAWSHKIWKDMSTALNNKWSFQTCWLNVYYDRNSILSIAREEMGIVVPPKLDQNISNSDLEEYISNRNSEDDTSFEFSFELNNEKNLDMFDLVLTEQQWNEMKPDIKSETKVSSGRLKLKLKPGVWTNEISISFWQQFRLPCAFVFKRAEIILSLDDTTYTIKIIGSCKSKICGNTFRGYLSGLPTELNTTNENFEPMNASLVDHSYSMTSIANEQQLRNQDPRKISKFFKAYPEVRHRNTLIAQKKKSTLLLHGSRCLPVKIKEESGGIKSYYVTNTCAFDALLHILMTAAIDDVNYFNFLKGSKNCTLKLVCNLIEKGATQAVFRERALILKNLYPCQPHIQTKIQVVSYAIDATDSIANLTNKTLFSEPSVGNTEICSHCEGRIYETIVLAPNHKIIVNKGFGYLETALRFRSPIFKIKCRDPCMGAYTWLREPRIHIMIELDIRYDVKCTGKPCIIKEMPTTLTLEHGENISSKYRLVGIVAFDSGHYIPYCLRTNGIWEIYDDLAEAIRTCSSNTKINPHLAVYIRC